MTKSKLPRRLGIMGFVFGFGLMAMWWYIDTYNPFHLPSVEQVQSMTASYSAPPLYRFLENLIFALFPALWLSVFTIHAGPLVNYSIWVFAVLLDGAILYCVGLLVNAIRAQMSMPKRE
ncbi:MAG TPA: hypothetical protein VNE63_11680 [Candidatus Acidoferrales bacterium]|nr:hypothetical protein [Candidatus Acidoferrales bacterium]